MTRILLSTFISYHLISHPRAKYLMYSFLCLFNKKKKTKNFLSRFKCTRNVFFSRLFSSAFLICSFTVIDPNFTFMTFKTSAPIITNTTRFLHHLMIRLIVLISMWYKVMSTEKKDERRIILRNFEIKYKNIYQWNLWKELHECFIFDAIFSSLFDDLDILMLLLDITKESHWFHSSEKLHWFWWINIAQVLY